MDWSMLGYSAAPSGGDELMDDDDNEDFYGEESSPSETSGTGKVSATQVASIIHPSSTTAAAQSPLPSIPSPRSAASVPQQTSEQKPKTDNQLRAQELRAILIAKRQNTPVKSPRAATPATTSSKLNVAGSLSQRLDEKRQLEQPKESVVQTASSVALDSVEQLIAQGKAAAEAQAAALSSVKADSGVDMDRSANQRQGSRPVPAADTRNVESPATSRTVTADKTNSQPSSRSAPSDHVADSSYYDDLALWLELTNYHDIPFRKAQLQPYIERKALEAEAARIQERIALLDQAQQDNPPVFRFGTPTAGTHPPLPQSLPQPPSTLKRARSPDARSTPFDKFSRRDPPGSRLRGGGVGDSPSFRQGRPRSRSPLGPGGFADSHRRADGFDDRSRDASLERRQARYYNNTSSSDPRRDDDSRPDSYPARQNPYRDDRYHEPRGGGRSSRAFSYRGGERGGFS